MPGLVTGDTILNRAYIYFDYQKPVVTDYAYCIIVDSVISIGKQFFKPVKIKFYPNPASKKLNIDAEGIDKISRVRIVDMSGRLVRVIDVYNSSIVEIDLTVLKTGIYQVFIDGENDSYFSKIQIVNY